MATLGVGAGWWWRRPTGDPQPRGPQLVNAALGYSIELPSANWQSDPVLAREEKVDLALRLPNSTASITIRAGEATSADLSIGQLADELRAEWSKQIGAALSTQPLQETLLSGVKAARLVGAGEYAGEPIRRDGVVAFHQGIWYRVVLTAPAATADAYSADFMRLLAGFQITADNPNWRQRLQPILVTFASKKHPYQLKAVKGDWMEVPDLQTSSLFADLKLVDRTKRANLVVSPRQTKSLDGMRDSYVARLKREYAKVLLRDADRDLTINGLPAQQITALVNDPIDDFTLLTTFIQGGDWCYQLECRCPQAQRGIFEPAYDEIRRTFTIVTSPPPGPKSDPVTGDPSAKQAASKTGEMTKAGTKAAVPVSKRKPPEDLDFDDTTIKPAKPSGKSAAPPEANPKPADPPAPPTELAKKKIPKTENRRALDDLD